MYYNILIDCYKHLNEDSDQMKVYNIAGTYKNPY